MELLFIIVGVSCLLGFFAIFLILGRPSHQHALLEGVMSRSFAASEEDRSGGSQRKLRADMLAKPFQRLRGLFGNEHNPQTVRRLMLAGYRKPAHVDIFLGARLALPVLAGLFVAFFVESDVFLWFILAVGAGFFLPNFWLTRAITQRRERIRLSLPDALDLLVICIEAGLGLDQAVVRVGTELKLSHRALSEELLQINLEQRAGHPRIGAWRDMAERVNVESVSSFVNMLVQTERFGTPISKSLGVFSDSLRTQRRQKAEEMAAKTTIKLVLPLVFFIFPSIFIVTMAPAVITIMKSFGSVL
jgi:tight adherence protein C